MFETFITSLEIDLSNKASWYFDLGVSKHVVGENNSLNDFEKKITTCHVKSTRGQTHYVEKKGKAMVVTFAKVNKIDEVCMCSTSPKACFQ